VRQVVRYAITALVLLSVVVIGLWPWLDARGRLGILAAALVAYPVQVTAFALLIRQRDRGNRFLAVWAGGTVVRFGVILAAAFIVFGIERIAAAPMLLALAGFFFGLLLLEPAFMRPEPGETTRGS